MIALGLGLQRAQIGNMYDHQSYQHITPPYRDFSEEYFNVYILLRGLCVLVRYLSAETILFSIDYSEEAILLSSMLSLFSDTRQH